MEKFRYRIIGASRMQSESIASTSLPFWLYFVAITSAEFLTVYLQPLAGVLCHGVILVALLVQSAFISMAQKRNLILALTLVPLIRILSLALPLAQLSQIYWYPLIYAPLLVAALVVMRMVELKPSHIGLVIHGWPLQITIGIVTGLAFGAVEYLILRPEPLVASFTLQQIWLPAIILLCTTGFVEELIFRGVLQQLAEPVMGSSWGIIYVSLLFAVLHLGFFSLLDVVFVMIIALFYSAVVKRTGSLIGVTLSHGIANTLLFLVEPFVLG